MSEKAIQVLGNFDVESWVSDYELRADSGDYKPNNNEQYLLTDFAHGLIAELQERIRVSAAAGEGVDTPSRGPTNIGEL